MDSNEHVFSFNLMCEFFKSAMLVILAAFLFFNSIMGIIILIPYGLFLAHKKYLNACEQGKRKLLTEFEDALSCMLTALEAGAAIEGQIIITAENIKLMHGEKSALAKRLIRIDHKLLLGESIEKALEELAEEVSINEINSFVDSFIIARKSGGNVIELIRATINDLKLRKLMQKEVEGIIAGALNEVIIMKCMPLAILLYLRMFSDNFLNILYETGIGRVAMLIICAIYFLLCEYSDNLVKKAGEC